MVDKITTAECAWCNRTLDIMEMEAHAYSCPLQPEFIDEEESESEAWFNGAYGMFLGILADRKIL